MSIHVPDSTDASRSVATDVGTRPSCVSAKHSLIACRHCDLLQHELDVAVRGVIHCARCGSELYRSRRNSIDLSLSLGLACAQVFVIANAFPMVTMKIQGDSRSTTLMSAIETLYEQHMAPLALLVFVTTVLAPGIEIATIVFLLLSLRLNFARPYFTFLFRLVQSIRHWGMIDVLMLGVLVAIVKLGSLAEIVPGTALWAFGILLPLIVALGASFNPRDLWRWHSEHFG